MATGGMAAADRRAGTGGGPAPAEPGAGKAPPLRLLSYFMAKETGVKKCARSY